MASRTKRKRPHLSSQRAEPSLPKLFPSNPLQPASKADKANWNGFSEIESEPAFFNVMLREFGVQGIKVQEVFSLDDEFLACLPRPIYGLIFLFRWSEEDPDKQEQSCPDGVWFANQVSYAFMLPTLLSDTQDMQTTDNACASVALLNIVNNIPNIELGEHLQQFKDFTAELTPALRGEAISNFSFIKQIHNSFARKIDMLNADLHLKNTAQSRRRGKGSKSKSNESDAGFHFIAYVPINGDVWKFDGLERQPQKLGSLNSVDWITEAKPDIETRMASNEEGAGDFVLMSLVQDPLVSLIPALASNVRGLSATAAFLNRITRRWSEFMCTREGYYNSTTNLVRGPDPEYGLSQAAIDEACVPRSTTDALFQDDCGYTLRNHSDLIAVQAGIRASIKEEQAAKRSDEEKASGRRFDFGPLTQRLAQVLARKRIAGAKKRRQKKKQKK